MKGDINRLVGKDVEVIAHGFIYRGILIEIGIEEIHLKSKMGWITISTQDITDIRDPSEARKGPEKIIDKEYFDMEV